ncbi:MAG: hypothetical protein ABT20_07905 [Rubrivivax sp. SCN 70-15]|nr:MAG: hypothetical protein ABT20_07905 [Rubrivivax sp. SCN 70-15]
MNCQPKHEAALRTAAAGVDADWKLLFSTVKNRLRQTVDEQDAVPLDVQDQQLARRVQAGARDCLAALDELHAVLVGQLDRRQHLEHDVVAARRALEQARTDLARAQSSELRARRQALHDELTTLPNRGHFHEQLEDALNRAEPGRRALTLMYLDLDGFKSINDLHGHLVGDQLLRIVAVRLARAVRSVDVVGRLGGDEFACLLRGAMTRDELSHLACKLLDAVSAPVRLGALQLSVRTSIGVAICPALGGSARSLLEQADAAMYRAKRLRSGYEFHGPGN